MTRTADYLLDGLKKRAIVPANQSLYTDYDILCTANDIIFNSLMPLLVSLREEFYVTKTRTTVVANQVEYDIPYRTIGRVLREVKYVIQDDSKRRLTRVNPGDEHLFRSSGSPAGFYMYGDKICLVPKPTQTGELELWWLMQPNMLVPTSDAAVVESIVGDVVTFSSMPSSWTAQNQYDMIQGKQGCSILAYDLTPASVDTALKQITFVTGEIPTALAAGDWVALAQETPVIMLPDEMYHLLEVELATHILSSLGDHDGAKYLSEDLETQYENVKKILEPRVIGEPKKIVNRSGLLRGSRTRYRWGWVTR